MRRVWWSTAAFGAFLSYASPADAQTGRFYVGGGFVADHDQTNSALTEDVGLTGTLVVGFDVSRHVGLRMSLDTPRTVSTFSEGFAPASTVTMVPQHRYEISETRTSMTYSWGVDLHGQIAPRIRNAATLALATVTHESDRLIRRTAVLPDGTTSPLEDIRLTGDYDWTTFPLGVEVPVQVWKGLEVVPELRVYWFVPSDSPRPYIVRSGVAVRWRFF
jgi:hypothetical protein